MKKYYYCEANLTVYTEKEMRKSVFHPSRFVEIGAFKNRLEAEIYVQNEMGEAVMSGKRI